MGVQSYRDGRVTGVNLTERYGANDPIELFAELGYTTIAKAVAATPDMTAGADKLIRPFPPRAQHRHGNQPPRAFR